MSFSYNCKRCLASIVIKIGNLWNAIEKHYTEMIGALVNSKDENKVSVALCDFLNASRAFLAAEPG